MKNKLGFFIFIGLLLSLGLAEYALAEVHSNVLPMPNFTYPTDKHPIMRILDAFYGYEDKIYSVLSSSAKTLFYYCIALELAWLGARTAFHQIDLKTCLTNFVMVIFTASIFLLIINEYQYLVNLFLESFYKIIPNEILKDNISTTELTNYAVKPLTLGVDIISLFWYQAFYISGIGVEDMTPFVLDGMVVIVCFGLITLQIILVKCEFIVGIFSGLVLVGLGATSFFREYAVNVLKYAFSICLKLMVMRIILAIGDSLLTEMAEKVGATDFITLGVLIVFCLIFYSLIKVIPETVASFVRLDSGHYMVPFSSGHSSREMLNTINKMLANAGGAVGSAVKTGLSNLPQVSSINLANSDAARKIASFMYHNNGANSPSSGAMTSIGSNLLSQTFSNPGLFAGTLTHSNGSNATSSVTSDKVSAVAQAMPDFSGMSVSFSVANTTPVLDQNGLGLGQHTGIVNNINNNYGQNAYSYMPNTPYIPNISSGASYTSTPHVQTKKIS